ncbi:sigma-70 family RNA polymerase sigma factor [Paenibacillus sp. MBLB4367]|uniref:sigma-70 family RNA polymerase sigma factor n=1 Tax=Paenibacillus sp. MBLB4367 TaxID=3384767 RepID=UPI0039080790
MHDVSDEQLMRMIGDKQSEALRVLYDRYVRLVYSFAWKAKGDPQFANDVVQLVFTKLWTTETSYDSAKGLFVNWLLTVTRHVTIDQLRKERKQEALVPYDDLSVPGLGEDERHDRTQDIVAQRLLKQQIEEASRQLSDSQARLIRELYWEGYTLSEIAERNREPVGTVKSRLHQSLKRLREYMKSWREE